METALSTLILVFVILFAMSTMAYSYFSAQATLTEGWQTMVHSDEERARAGISVIGSQGQDASIQIALRNTGSIKLADFNQWDVFVHYYDDEDVYHIERLSYSQPIQRFGQWQVGGIYADASQGTPEAHEPGILNPEEELVIEAVVDPGVKQYEWTLVAVATANGTSTSTVFEND